MHAFGSNENICVDAAGLVCTLVFSTVVMQECGMKNKHPGYFCASLRATLFTRCHFYILAWLGFISVLANFRRNWCKAKLARVLSVIYLFILLRTLNYNNNNHNDRSITTFLFCPPRRAYVTPRAVAWKCNAYSCIFILIKTYHITLEMKCAHRCMHSRSSRLLK